MNFPLPPAVGGTAKLAEMQNARTNIEKCLNNETVWVSKYGIVLEEGDAYTQRITPWQAFLLDLPPVGGRLSNRQLQVVEYLSPRNARHCISLSSGWVMPGRGTLLVIQEQICKLQNE